MPDTGSRDPGRKRLRRALHVIAFAVTASLALAAPSFADSAQISIASPANGSTITNSRANMSFTVTGATISMFETRTRCLIDGSSTLDDNVVPCSPTGQYEQNELRLTNGTHHLDIYAWDGPSNVAHASSTFTVSDTKAPTVAITPYPNANPVTGPMHFGVLIGGAADAVCRIDLQSEERCDGIMSGADPTTGQFYPKSLPNGAHTVFATATDPAGNATTASLTFTVNDTTAPALSIVSPAPGATVTTSPLGLTIQLDDRRALVECKLDGGSYSDCIGGELYCDSGPNPTCGTRLLGLTNGAHTVSIRASDVTGNVSPEQSVSFTVNDTTAPTLAVTAPTEGDVIDGSAGEGVAVQFGSPDPGKYDCSTDAGAFVPCMSSDDWQSAMTMWGWPGDPVEGNGPHTISAKVTDAMGRSAADSVNFTVDDSVAPNFYIAWPRSGAAVTSPFTVIPSGPDANLFGRCEIKIDSNAFQTCDAIPGLEAISAAPGPHTIHLRWSDWVGNQTQLSREIVVVETPPVPGPAPLPASPKPTITASKIAPRRRGARTQLPIRFALSVPTGNLATSCRGKAEIVVLSGRRRLTTLRPALRLERGACVAAAKPSFKTRSIRGKRLRITLHIDDSKSGFADATRSIFVKLRR